jgi:hypothetical protein
MAVDVENVDETHNGKFAELFPVIDADVPRVERAETPWSLRLLAMRE